MTVKQLIEKLKEMPEDMTVVNGSSSCSIAIVEVAEGYFKDCEDECETVVIVS